MSKDNLSKKLKEDIKERVLPEVSRLSIGEKLDLLIIKMDSLNAKIDATASNVEVIGGHYNVMASDFKSLARVINQSQKKRSIIG